MSDLQERLRGPAMREFGLAALGNEAADEIARLEAEVEALRLRLELQHSAIRSYQEIIEELRVV